MSLVEIGTFLKSSELGQFLTRPEQVDLASWLLEVSKSPDEVIFRQGQPGDGIYFISKGVVEILFEPSNGVEMVITTLGPGSMIGEFTLLDLSSRSATAVARSGVRLFFLPLKTFLKWKEMFHPVIFKLLKYLTKVACSRLRQMNEQIALQLLEQDDLLIDQLSEGDFFSGSDEEELLLSAAKSLYE